MNNLNQDAVTFNCCIEPFVIVAVAVAVEPIPTVKPAPIGFEIFTDALVIYPLPAFVISKELIEPEVIQSLLLMLQHLFHQM